MSKHVVGRFSSVRNLLAVGALTLISVVAVNPSPGRAQSPTATAPAAATTPEFEVATIRLVNEPNPGRLQDRTDGRRYTTRYTTLRDLIMNSYRLDPRRIVGGWPGLRWMNITSMR